MRSAHVHRSDTRRCEDACKGREVKKGEEKENVVFQQPLRRESSISLVMVLLIEGGLAEEPRAALGGAGGKGHCLQHCIENDRDNSQDRTRQRQFKKSRLLQELYWLALSKYPTTASGRAGRKISSQC